MPRGLTTPSVESQPQLSGIFEDDNYQEEPLTAALLLYNEEVKQAKGLAPVDALTGMPLPVLPPSAVLSFENTSEANWHHHYHPSSDDLLTSDAGLAVRHLRLQLLPIPTHNQYHNLFLRPEKLPRTNTQRFGHIILGCAGYIPPYAIDVRSQDPSLPVTLSKKKRHRLQTSGEIEVRGHCNMSSFMKDHLIRQDLSHVNESIIDEFIDTTNIERKKYLGHWLLAIASEVAVEPVIPVYRQALEEGLITPQAKLPALAKSHINGAKTSKKAISALHKRLSKQRSSTTQA